MSIDFSKPPRFHFELAKELQKLRNRGVLILASGNIVHNLRQINWGGNNAKPYGWALEFDTIVKNKLDNYQLSDLADFQSFGALGQLAHPSYDHYLPLLYTAGLANNNEPIKYLYEGFDMGSISMRCFQAG